MYLPKTGMGPHAPSRFSFCILKSTAFRSLARSSYSRSSDLLILKQLTLYPQGNAFYGTKQTALPQFVLHNFGVSNKITFRSLARSSYSRSSDLLILKQLTLYPQGNAFYGTKQTALPQFV